MLTWTAVVAEAPTDADIADTIARREALVIRPLIEFAPLRRAMGLAVADDVQGAPAVATVGTSGGRRRPTGTKAPAARATSRSTTTRTSAKPKQPAKPKQAATVRTPDTAAA